MNNQTVRQKHTRKGNGVVFVCRLTFPLVVTFVMSLSIFHTKKMSQKTVNWEACAVTSATLALAYRITRSLLASFVTLIVL